MQAALRIQTTVLPGSRVEISAPELPEGAKVEVIVVLPNEPVTSRRVSMVDFLEKPPFGPRAFDTWEEYEEFLRKENDSWE